MSSFAFINLLRDFHFIPTRLGRREAPPTPALQRVVFITSQKSKPPHRPTPTEYERFTTAYQWYQSNYLVGARDGYIFHLVPLYLQTERSVEPFVRYLTARTLWFSLPPSQLQRGNMVKFCLKPQVCHGHIILIDQFLLKREDKSAIALWYFNVCKTAIQVPWDHTAKVAITPASGLGFTVLVCCGHKGFPVSPLCFTVLQKLRCTFPT